MTAVASTTTLRVPTDPTTTLRYAEVSGDRNPIHLDRDAALAAGLPGPILHGLYTMAQVARCACAAVGDGRQSPLLRRLSVQFRGVGLPGGELVVTATVADTDEELVVTATVADTDEELVVTATVADTDGELVELDVTVEQDGRRLIRRGRARLTIDGWIESRPVRERG